MADWLLYEHDDGRHAVAPSAEAATFAHGDPAWHRVGPVMVVDGVQAAGEAQEREAFEAAMRPLHPEWAFTADPVFDYHNERTRCAWEGWKAARGVEAPEHG